MTDKPKRMDDRFIVKADTDFKARVQRIAADRYGTNTSLLIRIAVERFIEPLEADLAEREAQESVAA